MLAGIAYVIVRLDDILVSDKNDAEHLRNQEEVLKRLSNAGLRAKENKCVFMAAEVVYCGHKVTAESVTPVETNVQAINEAPRPENTSQLKFYLDIINYYHKFLPKLSTALAPLHKLFAENKLWNRYSEQDRAFYKSKERLTSSTLLVHYSSTKEIVLTCDALPYGVGAVISHVMENGDEKPFAYASRTLTAAEKIMQR